MDAITHRRKHLGTEFINAIVTLSEAKHPAISAVADTDFIAKATENFLTLCHYKIGRNSWILRPAQNDIITDVLSHSYTVRHFRAEHPFINRMRLFADSWPGEFSCYQSASTCPHCCAIVVAHFK